jgi:hypothetical protein
LNEFVRQTITPISTFQLINSITAPGSSRK